MHYTVRENYDADKRAEVEATVSEVMHCLPSQTVSEAQNVKHQVTVILAEFFDRVAEHGRYLEWARPSQPEIRPLILSEM